MMRKILKLSLVIVAVALLLTSYGLAMPEDDDRSVLSRLGHLGPAPVEPELSKDGMTLYNGGLPVVYVANPDPAHEPARIPPPINLLTAPESATSSFSLTFVPDGGTDPWAEPCYTFPAEAQAAFSAAASIWANIIQSSVPITIRACWADLGSSSILGYSGGEPLQRDFTGAPRAATWYAGSLANALAGFDLGPGSFDMHITYNSNFTWYYGTDGLTPLGQYDLMSVVLHEMAHGLNFFGLMSYSDGTGSWGYLGYPSIYDVYMRDGSGNELINTSIYPNPSTGLGSALTSNNIWFHGSNAIAANGGARVKMFAPSTWSDGSSYSHLDYSIFNETPNELMVYAISSGESVHDPGPVTRGLLKDLGWQIAPVILPDLIEADLSDPPATATAGDSFAVTDTVMNQGNASAGSSTTSYYLSFDTTKGSSGDILLTGSRSVPPLEPGASESGSLAVAIPSNIASGSYYLLACADNTNAVVESNEGNNCIASASQVNVSAVISDDPNYAWHTFYGGVAHDTGRNIATDGSGNIYITGESGAPWTGPAGQQPLHGHSGGYDIFVLKLDSSGSYVWHTFYGSGTWDLGYGIAADGSGNIYITGESDASWNGPAGQAPLHTHSGNMDMVTLKLNSSGAYQWHTYYGSSRREDPRSIVTDESGNVYVAGFGEATWNGPAGQSPLRAFGGVHNDFFVLKLHSSGSYQWHTFSGATNGDNSAYEIAPDGNGGFYIAGYSASAWSGPAGQPPLHAYTGGGDPFVMKLDSSGTYQWHTFYGSSASDQGQGIAADGSGNVYCVGISETTWNGPAGQPPLHAHSGGVSYGDIFVLKLGGNGSYQWHTFYGSSADDWGMDIVTDTYGSVYATGVGFATWNGPAGQSPLHPYAGGNEIFVLKLNPSGSYQWHTFYGTSYGDYGMNIVTNGSGNIYITGESGAPWNGPAGQSPLHPYSGSYGISELYVLKLAESSVCNEPFINSQPQSQTIQSGQTATLSVTASGTTPFAYQWYQGSSGNTSTPVGTNSSNYTTPPLTQTTSYWVRISNSCGSSDSTGAAITVTGIYVVSPTGGETLTAGSTQTILWTYSGNLGPYVKIELLKAGAVNRIIKSLALKGSGGNGSCSWTIPANQAPGADYRIRVTSASNAAHTDMSDSNFTIVGPPPPTISVTSPNGGESLPFGMTQTIRWDYTGNPGAYLKIELLKGGVFKKVLTSLARTSTRSFNWRLPVTLTPGADYSIRITSRTNLSWTDTSDSNFTIAAPTVALTSPNGGEAWVPGTTQTIQWTFTGGPGTYLKIELLKGGILNRTITYLALTTRGSFSWRIPATQVPGADYSIRITSRTISSCTDTSDLDFTIGP